MIKRLLAPVFILFLTTSLVAQINYTIETITSGMQFPPAWTTTLGDYTAWMQNPLNTINLYDGNTIKQIPNAQNGYYPSSFYMTESLIANQNVNNNGVCLDNTVYDLENELSVSRPCKEIIASNSINLVVRGAPNFVFEILDTEYQPIFQMPFSYQGFPITSSPSQMSYWNNTLFFISGNNLFKYDISTDQVIQVYMSQNSLAFYPYRNDETFAFIEVNNLNEKDLYYYDGTSTQLILNDAGIINTTVLSFKNKVYWQTNDDALLCYDPQNGVIDTLANRGISFVVNAIDCYVMWGVINFSTNTSTLFLNNGSSTSSIQLAGIINGDFVTQMDNGSVTVVIFDPMSSSYSIKKINFETPCCTDEDIITSEHFDYLSETYIQSDATITNRKNLLYQAEDYVEIQAGFEVNSPTGFHALIGECILYNE